MLQTSWLLVSLSVWYVIRHEDIRDAWPYWNSHFIRYYQGFQYQRILASLRPLVKVQRDTSRRTLIDLASVLILTLCPENGSIYDPFMKIWKARLFIESIVAIKNYTH